MRKSIRELVLAAVCLAFCLYLPFLTGQIPQWGNMLSPMHIPVLLCGLMCGWPYAMTVGLIAPPLRYALFGMPPIMPTGAAMMVELAVYGLSASLLRRALPKRPAYLYVSLILAMLLGRVFCGLLEAFVFAPGYTWAQWLRESFVICLPGIVLQLAAIPLITLALRRCKIAETP